MIVDDKFSFSPNDVHFNEKSKDHPKFWEKLSSEDQLSYSALQPKLAVLASQSRRSKSNEVFCEILNLLKAFVVRGDDSDSIRGLVCGIVWLDSGIAINTHQLRLISSKCKSSINASFQSLGYGTIPSGADVAMELVRAFPFMQNQFALLRQWTIRQKVDQSERSLSLCDLVQQKCEERQRKEEYLTPPPTGEKDRWVSSYLNDECSLGEMVKGLIEDRKEQTMPEKKVQYEVPGLEEDPFSFFGRQWDGFDLSGEL
jgi:hypothetical protein